MNFFVLEGAYLAIAAFILIITIFVSTRPFMGKGVLKVAFPIVFLLLSAGIMTHYFIITDRMKTVKNAFEDGKVIICESRATRGPSRSILIEKDNSWRIEEYTFYSDNYERGFHTSRCLVHYSES